jgi:DNA-binding NtrC family response regulator
VPALVEFFRERAQTTHRLPEQQFSPAALRALANAEWPGNIRQLSHVVEAAAIRGAAEQARQIEVEHLFPDHVDSREEGAVQTYQHETRRFQTQLVKKVLESTGWNISAAARQLDLTRAHLYNLIKSFGLER